MARPPEPNAAFLREVDDEVRRDAMARAARRYGLLVVVLAVLGLAAFAGYLVWRHHAQQRAGARGEALTAALSQVGAGAKDGARKGLTGLAKDGGPAYGTLAAITLADMQVQAGADRQAAAAFLRVAGDAAAPQPLRDLALVRATALDFDRLAPAEVIRRLRPLAVPGGAWFGSAGEMTAIAQMKAGRRREAGTLFAAVARAAGAPTSVRERTRQLAGDLGVDTEVAVVRRVR